MSRALASICVGALTVLAPVLAQAPDAKTEVKTEATTGNETGAEAETEPLAGAELAQRIEAYLQPFLDAGHLSGTLLVARDGKVVFERAYGMANYELEVPNTPLTRHCVASITKPMTIAVVA